MATHRNRYVKVILFEPSPTNLQGGVVVGQYGEYLLVERPQPKERKASATTPRKRRTKAELAAAAGATSKPNAKPQPATAFPPAVA